MTQGCGTDCFVCHQVDKVIQATPEHGVIGECIACHDSIKPQQLFYKVPNALPQGFELQKHFQR